MPKTAKQRIPGLRERLIQLRGDRSQDEIAKKLNIARQTYGFYETGDREPNLSTLLKLSELYNVSTDYLLGHEKVLRIIENISLKKQVWKKRL